MSDPVLRALYQQGLDAYNAGDFRAALRIWQEVRARMTDAHSIEQYAAVDEAIALARSQTPAIWPWVVGGVVVLGVGYWAYRRFA